MAKPGATSALGPAHAQRRLPGRVVLDRHAGEAGGQLDRHRRRLAVARGRRRRDPQAEQIARLEQEKRQLEQELAKTRFVVEVQAKLHALLETLSESAQPENGSMK